jgi:hypothetical protein
MSKLLSATALLAALTLPMTAAASPSAPTTPVSPASSANQPSPAGVADYTYIQAQYLDWGSSDYFGDSAKGPGAEFSFQFDKHAFAYGDFDRLAFDRLPGYLYRTGVGLGYAQSEGKVSAYLRAGYYREMLSASLGGARSYYWEFGYGMRGALTNWLSLEGELYTDINPEFGSRPWGVKFGAAAAFGPVSLHLAADHNRDVNSLVGMLRFAF